MDPRLPNLGFEVGPIFVVEIEKGGKRADQAHQQCKKPSGTIIWV